jgi:DNA transformation protein and related proteins
MAKSHAFARLSVDVQRIVNSVPHGRVMTLDAIGAALDIPVRHVAFIASHHLKQTDTTTPWHRLVKRDGRLVTPQAESRLCAEGVKVINGVVQNLHASCIDVAALKITINTPTRPPEYAVGVNREPPLASLRGLGPASVAMLGDVGIRTTAKLKASDPFTLYLALKQKRGNVSINLLYALIGAIEDRDWREVARQERTTILLKLDDLTLAKK